MSGSITVEGTVLETEHKQGTFKRDDGTEQPYDFYVTSVLVGTKVVEVRFNPDNGDARPPADGAVIQLHVELPKGVRVIAKRYAEARAVKAV